MNTSITDGVKQLIIVNIILFVAANFFNEYLQKYMMLYFPVNDHFGLWQFVTHMFMHGSFGHILFNMYGLWAFGSILENIWGTRKFVFFYFSAGLGAALIYVGINYMMFQSTYNDLISLGMSSSEILNILETGSYPIYLLEEMSKDTLYSFFSIFNSPMLGASGAVYGVLVAFGMSFPNAKLGLLFIPFPIKAKYFIPGLICMDLILGISNANTGIAHFAHVGGAVIGFAMMMYWKKNQFKTWN